MADFASLEASMIGFFSSASTSCLIALAGDGRGGTTQIEFDLISGSCFRAGVNVMIGDPCGSETFWFMTNGGGDLGEVCDDELVTEMSFGKFLAMLIGKFEAGANGGIAFGDGLTVACGGVEMCILC